MTSTGRCRVPSGTAVRLTLEKGTVDRTTSLKGGSFHLSQYIVVCQEKNQYMVFLLCDNLLPGLITGKSFSFKPLQAESQYRLKKCFFALK